MKKTVLFIVALSVAFTAAEAKEKKKKSEAPAEVVCKQVFFNGLDSMSYALGTNVGTSLKKNLGTLPGGKYNEELFIKGFVTTLKGDSALMTEEFVKTFLSKFFTDAQAKELAAKKEVGEKFLAENKVKPGVITTASGLQYQILVPAEGVKPNATDSVEVHYTGYLLDGTKFDSSVDRGEPITFPLNQVIPGWTEGVQLMSVGSKYKFFVPYNLGYGEQGTPNGGPIPGFSTLIFEVELLKIKQLVEIAPVVEPVEIKKVATKVVKKATPVTKKAIPVTKKATPAKATKK